MISNRKFLTIFEIFNYFFLAIIFVGSVAINIIKFQYEDYFGFYDRPDLLFKIWLMSSLALMLTPFGAIVFNNLVRFYPKKGFKNFNALLTIQQNKIGYSYKTIIFFLFLFFLTLLVFFQYGNKAGDLAIYHIFESVSPVEFSLLRSDATNNFEGKFHRYQLFLTTLPKLLLVVAYLLMINSRKWRILFILIFVTSVFYSLLNVEKGPVTTIFLLIFLTHYFMFPEIRIGKIFFAFFGILTGLVFMYIVVMGMQDHGILDVLGAIFHRIFIGQVHPLYWWQLYLEEYGTLGFSGMPNPGGIFPFTPVSMTVIIHQFAFPEIASKGIVGSMPTAYFAYWMLSFGYFVSFVSMFILGFILQFVDFLFSKSLRSKPKIFTIGFYILMMDYFLRYVSDGFQGILFDFNWILPLFICFIYSLLTKENNLNKSTINE